MKIKKILILINNFRSCIEWGSGLMRKEKVFLSCFPPRYSEIGDFYLDGVGYGEHYIGWLHVSMNYLLAVNVLNC